jgi:GTP-binding protein
VVEAEVLTPMIVANDELFWDVEETDEGFRLAGKRLLKMVAMTDLTNDEAIRYLARRLERIGVMDRLRLAGAEEGDEVTVGDFTCEFTDEQ